MISIIFLLHTVVFVFPVTGKTLKDKLLFCNYDKCAHFINLISQICLEVLCSWCRYVSQPCLVLSTNRLWTNSSKRWFFHSHQNTELHGTGIKKITHWHLKSTLGLLAEEHKTHNNTSTVYMAGVINWIVPLQNVYVETLIHVMAFGERAFGR